MEKLDRGARPAVQFREQDNNGHSADYNNMAVSDQ